MAMTPEAHTRWHRRAAARYAGPLERTLLRQLQALDEAMAQLGERRADIAALIMRERAQDYEEKQMPNALKRIVMVVVAVFGLATAAQAQTSFPLGQPLTALWQGATNEVDAAVDHYEIRVDAGAFVTNGQPVPQAEYSYAIPQALLTIGAHTVTIRACAATLCGLEVSASFTIARPLPGLPRNPRVVPTPSGAMITIPQAIEKANAYSVLILDRPLTAQELSILSMRHPPVPPTRDTVLDLLDASFAEFVIREP